MLVCAGLQIGLGNHIGQGHHLDLTAPVGGEPVADLLEPERFPMRHWAGLDFPRSAPVNSGI